jgi:hypothetical protein
MRRIGINVARLFLFAVGVIVMNKHVAAQGEAEEPFKCDVGPVQKSYGGTPWLVYGCRESQNLVFLTAPQSPAAPFYFFLAPQESSFRLSGEGTGDRTLTDAAYNELKALGADEIAALRHQTQSAQQ